MLFAFYPLVPLTISHSFLLFPQTVAFRNPHLLGLVCSQFRKVKGDSHPPEFLHFLQYLLSSRFQCTGHLHRLFPHHGSPRLPVLRRLDCLHVFFDNSLLLGPRKRKEVLRSSFLQFLVRNFNETIRFFCFPCPIKNKFYPFILILVFSLLSGFPLIDLIASCAIGAIFTLRPNIADALLPSVSTLKKLESSCFCAVFTRFESFIPINDSETSATSRIAIDDSNNTGSSPNTQAAAPPQPRNFGGRGVSIGQGTLRINETSD